MADTTMNVSELLDKVERTDDVDFLREGARVLAEALMDAEASAQVGAAHGERAPDRRTASPPSPTIRRDSTRASLVMDCNAIKRSAGSIDN